jgi:hypothetical protein
MLKCSKCQKWQHTVCAGFYSNKDPRIKQLLQYQCMDCAGCQMSVPERKRFQRLARERYILSLCFNDGIPTANALQQKFSIPPLESVF